MFVNRGTMWSNFSHEMTPADVMTAMLQQSERTLSTIRISLNFVLVTDVLSRLAHCPNLTAIELADSLVEINEETEALLI